MGTETPKQFLEIAGIPVLMHTINAFKAFDSNSEIIIPMPDSHIDFWEKLCLKHSFNVKHKVVIGGETRFHSVLNGLNAIKASEGIVAVHDAVRPLVSQQTIKNSFDLANKKGNAVPVIEMTDSVRIIDGLNSEIIDRDKLRRIQTPQMFELNLLREAYRQTFNESFTDDASVVEALGFIINMCLGNAENIKITNKSDLLIAEALINSIAR